MALTMGYGEAILLLLKIGFEIWKSIKEADSERKKEITRQAQSGVRGIIDGDASRVSASIDNMRRMRR